MLDSGAPRSACGTEWMERFTDEFCLHEQCYWERFRAQLSGIGEGSASVNWRVSVPIGIDSFPTTFWTCQLLEGCGETVPPLLGLESMEKSNAVINIEETIYCRSPYWWSSRVAMSSNWWSSHAARGLGRQARGHRPHQVHGGSTWNQCVVQSNIWFRNTKDIARHFNPP